MHMGDNKPAENEKNIHTQIAVGCQMCRVGCLKFQKLAVIKIHPQGRNATVRCERRNMGAAGFCMNWSPLLQGRTGIDAKSLKLILQGGL